MGSMKIFQALEKLEQRVQAFGKSLSKKEGASAPRIVIGIGIIVLGSLTGCEKETNTAPVIKSFQANPTSVNPDGQVELTVLASDAENDPLTYTYQPSGGTIAGAGDRVTWVAPATAGSYEIKVSVSDGKLSVQDAVIITVAQPEKLANLKVQWFGHSCFLITSTDGKRVLTDPYGAGIGYAVPSVEADVVTVSHSHSDHNNVSMATGNPEVIMTEGESIAAGISFLGVSSWHDDANGGKRGKNIIFVWEMDGMRLAHLGDLGQPELTNEQLAEMGNQALEKLEQRVPGASAPGVDILFIPVGSVYTIDAAQATKIVEQLSPKVVFPMHYKTDVLTFALSGVDDFLAGKDNAEKINGNSIVIEKLPEKMKVIVLNYK